MRRLALPPRLLLAGPALLAPLALAPAAYAAPAPLTAHRLPPLAGDTGTAVIGIDDAGHVVGTDTAANGDTHAVRSYDGAFHDLAPHHVSTAGAVSRTGYVAVVIPDTKTVAVWSPVTQAETYYHLGAPYFGGEFVQAPYVAGISDAGVVAVDSPDISTYETAILGAGRVTIVPGLQAISANRNGLVAGNVRTPDDTGTNPALWHPATGGAKAHLDVLPRPGLVTSLNAAGNTLVGGLTGGPSPDAVVTPTGAVHYATIGADQVGQFLDDADRAYLVVGTRLVRTGPLGTTAGAVDLPYSGGQLPYVADVDPAGQIVGLVANLFAGTQAAVAWSAKGAGVPLGTGGATTGFVRAANAHGLAAGDLDGIATTWQLPG